MKYQENCENCQNKLKCAYKFQSTPKILIIKFNNPKKEKQFIKLGYPIEENIDLIDHLFNNPKATKYKLIKALYVFNSINDNKLYVDIPESESHDYIPFIIIYKKI